MSNVLSEQKREQVIALGRLGWTLQRIQEATGVRRETASAYLKSAGIGVRRARGWGRYLPPEEAVGPGENSKPAKEVSTDSEVSAEITSTVRHVQESASESHREFVEQSLRRGRNSKAIWQDLVSYHGFAGGYASVRRFVIKLRGATQPEPCGVIQTAPGEEAQVDYGEGPLVRHPETGKYRRTRLFVLTLGFSRKSVRLLVWKSSSQTWAELHEKAFRRLGGAPRVRSR